MRGRASALPLFLWEEKDTARGNLERMAECRFLSEMRGGETCLLFFLKKIQKKH